MPCKSQTSGARLYLGSHHATVRWWALGVPLFVSVRVLKERKRLPYAFAPWALDSGGFTELATYGKWRTSEAEYVRHVWRLRGIGRLAWVAPQDWMCEPEMVVQTGLTVREHQERTVASFLSLRAQLGALVIPVLQGYSPAEYDRCVSLYQDAGIDLQAEPLVGLGSVCKRSRTHEAIRLVHYLSDHNIAMHGFGLKGTTFRALRGLLASADSMAWSYGARRAGRDANSPTEAIAWRTKLLAA